MMPLPRVATTSAPADFRNAWKYSATSAGYVAAIATRRTPSAWTACAKAKEVLEAGRPAVADSSLTCSWAPSQPNTKLALVQAQTTAWAPRSLSSATPAARRAAEPISSSASTRWASSPMSVCTSGRRTAPPRIFSSRG